MGGPAHSWIPRTRIRCALKKWRAVRFGDKVGVSSHCCSVYLYFRTSVPKARDLLKSQKNSCLHSGESRASITDHSERQLSWNEFFFFFNLLFQYLLRFQLNKMLSELLAFMRDSDSFKNLMKAKGYLRKMGIYKKPHSSFKQNCLKPILLLLIIIINLEF